MRQNVPVRKPGPPNAEPDTGSRSIDEWLDAAIAEQARRTVPRAPSDTAAPAETAVVAPSASDMPSSARVSPATAAKSSTALNSMTSWLEKAQEEFADVCKQPDEEPAPAQPAPRRSSPSRSSYDALSTVERLDDGLESDKARSEAQAAQDAAFRNLENRIREIAGRLDTPRQGPIAGTPSPRPLEDAIIEIRARQAALDETPEPTIAQTYAPMPAAEPHTPIPALLPEASVTRAAAKAPAAQPARDVHKPAVPDLPAEPALPSGLEGLRRDIDWVQASIAALATRSDLGALERSIEALADEIAEARKHGGDLAPAEAEVEALQAQVERLTSAPALAPESLTKLARDIDVVSHKLDIVAAAGIDPNAIDKLAGEIAEVKALLGGMAAPGDVRDLSEQLSDMKLELARIGSRQVNSQDFASLRTAFEDMRDALSTGSVSAGSGGLTTANVQQATRDELQPIASMLVMLIEKIERLERHSGDPEMAEQIERQIAGLSATIGSTAARDPALSDLSHAMADLLDEVGSWRSGTLEIAEHAARTAVAETLEAMRGQFGSAELQGRRDERIIETATTARTSEHMPAEDVGTDQPVVPHDEVAPAIHSESADAANSMSDAELRRLNEAVLAGPMLTEADRPLPRAPENEVLLEPGAGRPRLGSDFVGESDSAADQRDIKASFIAAARRAAQAAAADADSGKIRPSERGATGTEAGRSSARIRSMLDRLRRPLLVSAAALVVAIGGYRLATELTSEQPISLASRGRPQATAIAAAPIITAPATNKVAAASDLAEPTTTASVAAPRESSATAPSPVRPGEQNAPAAGAVTPDTKPTALSSAASTPAEAAPQKQASQLPPAPPSTPLPPKAAAEAGPSLREAALNGDPAALYELAVRTMEGRGVPRDPRAAVGLFEKAGEKNLAMAQYRAGNAYEKGLGVGRDIESARRWYQRAAENGNTRAMHNLAVLMAEGAAGKPDYAAAMNWFQKAAELGVRDSQFNLAVLFARGLGTSQDLARSYTWFAIAAGQGDDEAGRKRDEVSARLPPADLARAKSAVERWRATPPNPAANEAPASAAKWSQAPARRSSRA